VIFPLLAARLSNGRLPCCGWHPPARITSHTRQNTRAHPHTRTLDARALTLPVTASADFGGRVELARPGRWRDASAGSYRALVSACACRIPRSVALPPRRLGPVTVCWTGCRLHRVRVRIVCDVAPCSGSVADCRIAAAGCSWPFWLLLFLLSQGMFIAIPDQSDIDGEWSADDDDDNDVEGKHANGTDEQHIAQKRRALTAEAMDRVRRVYSRFKDYQQSVCVFPSAR
jgi:hypothetical protein